RISEDVQVSEIIFYERMLEPEQRRIVESYFAMKYSVNITKNTNPDLRDYLDIFKDKAWSSRLDGLYNKEVLALGRLDTIGFYQSQTYSSDAQSISLSLQAEAEPGIMPELDLEDGSLLILSRKEYEAAQQDCGSSPEVNTWKLRLINWTSKEPTLYLTLDTILDSTQQPMLTDGSTTIPIKTAALARHTQLAIPLNKIETSGDLYLSLGAVEKECDPLAEVLIRNCNRMDSTANQLYIQVQAEALPATLNLVNLDTKEAFQTELNDPATMIGQLGAGQYQLNLSNVNRILSDKVFQLGSCGNDLLASSADNFNLPKNNEGSPSWAISTIPGQGPADLNEDNLEAYLKSLGIDLETNNSIAGRSIEVYPNPGSRLKPVSFRLTDLKGVPFTVQVFDSKGNLMEQKEFTPQGEVSEFRHCFRVDGSYFIQFTSAQYSETKHLRIKSNLH
ncbi:MAG: T9SS type A sorting domain-containing protein, partial [Owenweeksia sp.]